MLLENKKIAPQVDSKSGLSDEYRNQFLDFLIAFNHNPPRLKLAQQFYNNLKIENGFKKYLDMFPLEEFKGVATAKNTEAIIILNNKVNELWTKLGLIFDDNENPNAGNSNDIKTTNNFEDLSEGIDSFVQLGEEIDRMIGGESS